ncbi:CLM5 protein, partial [Bombycilla garrulus]|nr:CLM5 protein [Bombycilla garrulus]
LLLLLLLLLLRMCSRLQGQTSEFRRQEGDTLNIQCHYGGQDAKYWCLQTNGKCKETMYVYSGRSSRSSDGRTKIEDNSNSRTVSITMTDLKAEDSGTYMCAVYYGQYIPLKKISLNVFKAHILAVFQGPSSSQPMNQRTSLWSTFIVLTVVLLVLLLLALVSSVVLGVRYCRLLGTAGNREAEDTSDRAEGTAQPGSTVRRASSQDDSKGPAYINLDVQSQPSPQDPLYCNVEPSQAHRNPQHVEYAVIAFSPSARSGRD